VLLSAHHAHEGPIEEFETDVVARRLRRSGAQSRRAQRALQLAHVLAYDMSLIARVRAKGSSSLATS
jgi:hypothetical protein